MVKIIKLYTENNKIKTGGHYRLNFIPMGLNSRTERAYENALASVPGSTGLMNITYQEDWFWWVLGTGRTVTITGDAIKEVKE